MSQAPCILAIDTATGPCSAALWKNGKVAAYVEDAGPTMQSARLVPMIEKAMRQAGVGYGDLTAVASTIGPGSFTGIRVGLATASGIAFAAGIPGMGFSTLEVMALSASFYARPDQHYILSLLNAGKGEWYYQGFRLTKSWREIEPARVGTLQEALESVRTPALVAGNAGPLPADYFPVPVAFPRADALAAMAAMEDPAGALPLKPFYIRPPDAKPMAGNI